MVRLPPRLRPYFPQLKRAYTRATGAVAPATRRLSRLRGGYLPAGVALTMEHAAAGSGGRCVEVRPAETVPRPAALGSPAGHPTFAAGATTIPRVAAAELPGGRVLGPARAVVTGSGELLHELSWYFGTDADRPYQHPLFLHPFPPAPRHVPGRLGVLATRGDANYYHFLVDALPRLGVLERSGLAAPQRWYVPAGAQWQRDLLTAVGIPPEQWVDASTEPHVQADCLVVPGLPATRVLNPPWVAGWLRERLLAGVEVPPPEQRRPLYVGRGGGANNRSVVNEDAVLDLLRGRGFTVLDPGAMTVRDQITAFAGASVIVGPHGAGLTNLLFAPSGAAVVELFPAAASLPDCYWRLSRGVPGLDYRYLTTSPAPVRTDDSSVLVSDIEVDVAALAGLLDDLAQRAPGRVG